MWVLFAILIQADGYTVYPQGPFATMDQCFEARQYFMDTAPKPKINYEAVCIQTDVTGNGA
jgi:hypothetical protein